MRTRILVRRGAFALAALTFIACTSETTDDRPNPDADRDDRDATQLALEKGRLEIDTAGDPTRGTTVGGTTVGGAGGVAGLPSAVLMDSGSRWQKMKVQGTLKDADTGAAKDANDEIVIVRGRTAIDAAPLGAKTKAALKADFRGTALDDRDEDEDTVYVVHKPSADAVEAPLPKGGVAVSNFSSCDNYDKTYSDSLSGSKPFSHHVGNQSGAFTGSADLDGSVSANVGANVVLRIKRAQTYIFGCRTYAAAFKRLDVSGNASAQARVRANGHFQKAWHYEKEVAKPDLGSADFWVGPIPVHIGFNLPITAGLDASAVATLDADMNATGNASFDIHCNSSSCDGSKNVSFGFTNNKNPTMSVSAKVDVTPSVSASVRGYLYSESILYAQVGVKPKLPCQLFFYYGNQCGDANGDGTPETVNALTLDAGVEVDVTAKVSLFGDDTWSHDWAVLPRRSVAFWDLAPGGSSVLTPILHGSGAAITRGTEVTAGGFALRATGSMRPCWPYTDPMTYELAWGDGTTESFTLAPNAPFVEDHAVSGFSPRTLTLTAQRDSAGRTINHTGSITMRPHLTGIMTVPGGGVLEASL